MVYNYKKLTLKFQNEEKQMANLLDSVLTPVGGVVGGVVWTPFCYVDGTSQETLPASGGD